MKIRIIKWFLRLLWVKYPYLMRETVVGDHFHIHANPRKHVRAMVDEGKQEANQ